MILLLFLLTRRDSAQPASILWLDLGRVNLDLSLFREFKLTERLKLQFRAECFNFTNTPHFSNPGSYVSSVQYGTNADSTPNYSQIVNLNGFDQITGVNPASRLVDQRYWRLGLKVLF